MSESIVIEVADAVVRALNAGQFSEQFTAERTYNPERKLSQYKTLRVTVVPKGRVTAAADRSGYQQDIAIDIGIQKRAETDAEADTMMGLVDEVFAALNGRVLTDTEGFRLAVWVETGNEPIFVPDHLREDRVFTSVLTLTYRVVR